MLVFLDTEVRGLHRYPPDLGGLAVEDGRTCYGELARDYWLKWHE